MYAHIQETGLFAVPGGAVLAVSGGPDSVALLDLLAGLATRLGLDLTVGHVDHGISELSAEVADQVRAWSARYTLPIEVTALKLGSGATETAARHGRYAALRAMQRRLDARYLVTAHQADDQIETVVFRLLKGSGMAGLAGMAPVGEGGLVRPLLPFRRAELARWLAERFPDPQARPPVFDDPANRDERHDRTWLRTRLLPLLRERFGEAVDTRLLDVARNAAHERLAWQELLAVLPDAAFARVGSGVELALAPLRRPRPRPHPLHSHPHAADALGAAMLRAAAREAGLVLGPPRSERLLAFVRRAQSGQRFELGQGWVAEIVFDRVAIRPLASRVAPVPGPVPWGIQDTGQTHFGAWEISWRPERAGRIERGGWTTWVPPGEGTVRAARPGDRLVPLGGRGHRRLARLLMEARVPRAARASYPVVERAGTILWLPGISRAAAAVPAPGSVALRLECRSATVGAAPGSGYN